MAKKERKHPDHPAAHPPKNQVPPVPEIQGQAKFTKEKAKPITEK